jgi:hypothetical protein
VLFEAVEALALALASVTHFAVFHRHAPVLRHGLANAHSSSIRVRLQVLAAQLLERLQVPRQRLLHELLGQLPPQPLH